MADKILPELIEQIRGGFSPSKTSVFGFSDGDYLPFYFIDKNPEITLVNANDLHDIPYLKGEKDVELSLRLIGDQEKPTQTIESDTIAIGLHTSSEQIIRQGLVGNGIFDNKVVLLESAPMGDWRRRLNQMIDNGVFNEAKAIILCEFSAPIKRDFKNNYGIEPNTDQISEKKNALFQDFTRELKRKNPNILVYEAPANSFGHGSRNEQYMACGRCSITTAGTFIGINPINRTPSPDLGGAATIFVPLAGKDGTYI
jgi:hypothetical protein